MTKSNMPLVMVDDNESDRFLAKECFDLADCDFPWREFSSGMDFLAYLEAVKREEAPMPKLVLLDINMPQMDGFEVLRRVRADPFFEELPIFMMLTNSDNDSDRKCALDEGADGFQTKPRTVGDYVQFFASLGE